MRVELPGIATQPQTGQVDTRPAAGRPGAVAVKQQPKVPAGIADVATRPRDPISSRPIAARVGAEPLIAADTLQFEAHAGNVSAGSPPHTTLYAGQAQPAQAMPPVANSALPSARQSGVSSYSTVEGIVDEALSQRDYQKAISEAYASATPEVRRLMLNNTQVRDIITEVVNRATAVLTNEHAALTDASTGGSMNPQVRADSAIKSVNHLIQRFNPAFAGTVADAATKVFEQFYNSHLAQMPDGSVLGRDGVIALASLADRVAGSPEGDAAIAGFVAMRAWNGEGMLGALTGGVGKAYATAYERLTKVHSGDGTFVHDSLAASSMTQLRHLQSSAAGHSDALGEHGAQMARIAADFALFPAGRIQKAMDAYRTSMDDNWQRKEAALRQTIVGDGKSLLQHMMGLNNIAQQTGLVAEKQGEWEAIANDPKAVIAITAALENDPDLINGEGLKHVVGLLATLRKEPGPTGKLAFLTLRMGNVAATAFLRRTVLEKFNELRPGDPAAAAKITEALGGLRNKWFARILGLNVSEADLNQAVELVTETAAKYADNAALLKAGTATAEIARLNAAVASEFRDKMNKFEARVAAFNGSTLAGQMMRSLVVSVAIGLNFVGSLNATLDQPDAVKIARTVDLGLLAGQRTSDLLVSLGVDPTSPIGRYAGAKLGDVPGVGRWVGAKLARVPIGEVYLQIYTVLEAINAARSAFGWGVPQDTVQAGLSGVSTIGFGMAFARAYGAAEWTGPWGIVIAAAAARGQMIYDGVNAAHQDEKKLEICLKAAGVESDRSAKVLSQQMSYQSSVPGNSQLPFLSEYAASRNLDVVDWINSFRSDQVDRLSAVVQSELNNGQETPSQYRPQPVSPGDLAKDKKDVLDEFERKLILHRVIEYDPVLQGRAKP